MAGVCYNLGGVSIDGLDGSVLSHFGEGQSESFTLYPNQDIRELGLLLGVGRLALTDYCLELGAPGFLQMGSVGGMLSMRRATGLSMADWW